MSSDHAFPDRIIRAVLHRFCLFHSYKRSRGSFRLVADDSQTLEVIGLRYPADTGAYKCTAENDAGSAQDIATVFVQQQRQSQRPTPVTGSYQIKPLIYYLLFTVWVKFW